MCEMGNNVGIRAAANAGITLENLAKAAEKEMKLFKITFNKFFINTFLHFISTRNFIVMTQT